MRRSRFKFWEAVLIFLSTGVFSFSCYLYLADSRIIVKYFFGFSEQTDKTPIGLVTEKSGSLKRQISGESEFKTIGVNSQLYDNDVLVTDKDSSVAITLDNGGSANLGPNTMVRLAFRSDFALGTLKRHQELQVVTGNVVGQAGKQKLVIASGHEVLTVNPNTLQKIEVIPIPSAPKVNAALIPVPTPSAVPSPAGSPSPSPSPSPSIAMALPLATADQVRILSPLNGSHYSLDPFTTKLEKTIQFAWKAKPPFNKVRVVVWKVDSISPDNEKKKVEVFSSEKKIEKARGTLALSLKAPGSYEWEIQQPNGAALSTPKNIHGNFSVDREFEGIHLLGTLVGGKNASSNKLSGDLLDNFNITLRWEKLQGINEYQIWIGSRPTGKKALIQKTVKHPEYTMNKNKIFAGQFYYKASAELKGGFIATSKAEKFAYSFLPPVQVVPEHNAIITSSTLKAEGGSILLTWQKTNFTRGYELEISTDEAFKVPFIKKALKENYIILQNPAVGKYWWRVRSFSEKLSSPMSQPYLFTVTP